MRLSSLLLLAFFVIGCNQNHGRSDDGGVVADASTCGSPISCASTCGSDALEVPSCVDGAWRCPPGTIDVSTCPPGCVGATPPGCVCEGSAWVCDAVCPDGINPWDPTAAGSACRFEGATCSDGGDACGRGLFCTCESGSWNCLVAEPDPVCWCGREPTAGAPCSDEGAECGQCCPTADGPNWPAMQCVSGSWEPAACPEIVCPPVEFVCPSNTVAARGTACWLDAQECGDPCCGSAITCSGGRWERGPEAMCACEPGIECGPGSCTTQQYCRSRCGPDDGIETHCIDLPADCRSCECIALSDGNTCQMVDGHPHVSGSLVCG